MKLCFIADVRSPIAQGWIQPLIDRGDDVHVISTYGIPPQVLPGAQLYEVPIAFAQFASAGNGAGTSTSTKVSRLLTRRVRPHADTIRHVAGCIELIRHVPRIRSLLHRIDPDIVHALRVPFEGMVAARATPPNVPLVISIWGNDFTLQAGRNRLIAHMTRTTMNRADAVHADTQRDIRLASDWGFSSTRLTLVAPGGGGVDLSVFYPGLPNPTLLNKFEIPAGARLIINPRGARGYVCNEAFFEAIPKILERISNAYFICVAMQGHEFARHSVDRLGIARHARLLPSISRADMADCFRAAQVSVSPSLHDGTPNTLLEAMACGCFPVAGDLESIREWIVHGENGLLCDPAQPDEIADAVVAALTSIDLNKASAMNLKLIGERAMADPTLDAITRFYGQVKQASEKRETRYA